MSLPQTASFAAQPFFTIITLLPNPLNSYFYNAFLVAALLRVAGVTAGLAESNGSLTPGL